MLGCEEMARASQVHTPKSVINKKICESMSSC